MTLYKKIKGCRALVTGGEGFIGRALVSKLSMLGATVVSLDLHERNESEGMDSVTTVTADIKDLSALEKSLGRLSFDYVFNAAGYIDHTPYLRGGRRIVETHYLGVMNLIDQVYSSCLKRFVQIGSSDEYGNSAAPQHEGMREAAIAPYSAAKVAATHLIQSLARSEGFPGVVVRFFLVYGPGQSEKRFLPQVIKACLRDESFPTSEGKQLRDFCYIDDVVEAMIAAALSAGARGSVINVASGKPVSIREMVENVISLTGGGKPQWGCYPYRKGENMALYADITLAEKLLSWKPHTPLGKGLSKTIAYYKSLLSTEIK